MAYHSLIVIANNAANIFIKFIAVIYQVHCRHAHLNITFGFSGDATGIIHRNSSRNNRSLGTAVSNTPVIQPDNTADTPVHSNDIHIGNGAIDCRLVCFTHNSANPFCTLDFSLERNILQDRFHTGIPDSPHRTSSDSTDTLLPLNKTIRHMYIFNRTDKPCDNATHMVGFAHPPRHMEMVKIQVLDRTDKCVDKAHILFTG